MIKNINIAFNALYILSLTLVVTLQCWIGLVFVLGMAFLHKFTLTQVKVIKKKENKKITIRNKQELSNLYNEHIFAITHELRSPLAVINASVNAEIEHLRNIYNNYGELDAEQINVFKEAKKKLKCIFEQTEVMESFIANLAEHGSYTSDTQDGVKILELSTFLDNIFKNASNFSRSMKVFNNNIGFAGSQNDFDKVHVQVNPNDLTRILMNIFKNAGDAIWKKFGSLTSSRDNWSPELTISCIKSKYYGNLMKMKPFVSGPFGTNRKESQFYLVIEDNGPGITDENKAKIFNNNRFSTNSTVENLGMGLKICMGLAHDNDLSLFFDTDGEGTRIIIGFPKVVLFETDTQDPTVGILCKTHKSLYFSEHSEKLYDRLVQDEN